ncbi:unnamed protein product [Trichobilharzia regenti]|nr:unnamed protein product [Trichobilharzia regenti]
MNVKYVVNLKYHKILLFMVLLATLKQFFIKI